MHPDDGTPERDTADVGTPDAAAPSSGLDQAEEPLDEQPVPIGRGLLIASAALLVVALALIGFTLLFTGDDGGGSRPAGATYSYTIPLGTGAKVDQGTYFYDLFPDYLEVKVGDRLVVVNQDDRTHQLGVFSVRAGETLDYVFDQPGNYRGYCSLHGSDHDAVIKVTAA